MTGRKSSRGGALARRRSSRASMLGKAQSLPHLRPLRARQRRLRRARPVRLRHRRLRGVRRRASSSVSSRRPVRRRPLCPRFSVRRTPLPTRAPKGGTVACAGAVAQLLPRHREMDHPALPLPPAHHQNFSPRPLTSELDPSAGRLRSRPGGPRPAQSPPPHIPMTPSPMFTPWTVCTGVEFRILLSISMFRSMVEQVVFRPSTAVLTRRLGPPAGTTASRGRGSIPRGGTAAGPPLRGLPSSASTC